MNRVKKILILYGFDCSGHHAAALAMRESFLLLDPSLEIETLNYFAYTSRILESLSTRAFYRMVRSTPALWDRIYYNPRSEARFSSFRRLVRGLARRDAGDLMDLYEPDRIVCTQAFPCGMLNDFKKRKAASVPLFAVLTDYLAPSYWIYEEVDAYFVGSEEAREELVAAGIASGRIFNEGLPISPRFALRSAALREKKNVTRRKGGFVVVLSGGWSGWGALEDLALRIERVVAGARVVVVTGSNNEMYERLRARSGARGSRIEVMRFVDRFDQVLGEADILVGKAGGMTAAEALACGVPLVLVDSLPGQEQANAAYLCARGAALMASSLEEAAVLAAGLACDARRRDAMQRAALECSRPRAAMRIAGRILKGRHAPLPSL